MVDGQGNFGSVDDDPPAAMRYTEARLALIAEEVLADIDRDTVDLVPNFDGSLKEPTVLPARLPNLLVNGASGIAVGMATNIPPHNLREVCDAICHLIDHPQATTEDLLPIIPGPDFPTGALIVGREGIRHAYANGHGRILMRAKAYLEGAKGGHSQIIITELPYQVNKAALVEKIANLARERRLEGIADLRDESDRHGLRVVIDLKKEAQGRPILNYLYKHTALQTTFAVNTVALVEGQPKTLRLKDILEHYVAFRRQVLRRRATYDLQRARGRAHILEGLLRALGMLDQVIATIRRSPSAQEARQALMAKPFLLSEAQAQAVLDMPLRRLAALERQQLQEEYQELTLRIAELEELLANPQKLDLALKKEVLALKERYGDQRRTLIVEEEAEEFTAEDLIPHQEVVVTVSQRGYIKRIALESYRRSGRPPRGEAQTVKEEDPPYHLLVADTHDDLLLLSDRGRAYRLKVHELPDAPRQARGAPLTNLTALSGEERVVATMAVIPEDSRDLVLATSLGEVKRTALSEFASLRSNGLGAIALASGDEMAAALLAAGRAAGPGGLGRKGRAIPLRGSPGPGGTGKDEEEHALLITRGGRVLRFPVASLRVASRQSGGVRGIRLEAGDRVVAMVGTREGEELALVSERGYGKRTPIEQYPLHGRGGGGIIAFRPNAKTGPIAAARSVASSGEFTLVSEGGQVLRLRLNGPEGQRLPSGSREAQGVRLLELGAGDRVAAAMAV
ncbi:MAG TPA: DNA gyrase subunit A, partial [Dehalococcoidia bacterium]|nr:DNA gyrase subunit A [Dehalococcoidia bacterium]